MLDNPYVASVVVGLFSAMLFTLYLKLTDKDEKKFTTKFVQVFVATLTAGVAFAFVTSGASDETLNLPFEQGGLADF